MVEPYTVQEARTVAVMTSEPVAVDAITGAVVVNMAAMSEAAMKRFLFWVSI